MRWGFLRPGEDWRLKRTVDPTVEPVTLTEVKSHANYEDTDKDSDFTVWMAAARELTEERTQRAFLTQTWVLNLDCFPDDVIELRVCPVSSVTSVTYLDTAGATQTLATSVYTVDLRNEPARITLKYGQTWPSTYAQANAVTVTFVAGYGATPASVPAKAKMAIRMLVSHWFNNREAVGNVGSIVALAYDSLIDSLRWSGYR